MYQRGFREGNTVRTEYVGYAGTQPRTSILTQEHFNDSDELNSYRIIVRLFSSYILVTGDVVIPAGDFFTILRGREKYYRRLTRLVGTESIPKSNDKMFLQLRHRAKLNIEFNEPTRQIIVYSPLSLSVIQIDRKHAKELALALKEEHARTREFITRTIERIKSRELVARAMKSEQVTKQMHVTKYLQHLEAAERTEADEARKIHEELANAYKGLALGTHELIDDTIIRDITEQQLTEQELQHEEQDIIKRGKIPVRQSYLYELEALLEAHTSNNVKGESDTIPEF